MKINNKQKKIFKIFNFMFISVIMALTPFFANLNKNAINTVFASSTTDYNLEATEELNFIAADEEKLLDKKFYYNEGIKDNFSDGTVIIVLNKEETHKFKTYTTGDFPEIDCVSVKDLTSHTVDYVKEQIQNKKFGKEIEKTKTINVTNFRRILSLELREKDKENVIKAIRKLEKRSEIVSAEPNSMHTVCAAPNESLNTNTHYSSQWGLQKINAEAAWDITANSTENILVAVIDTGINGGIVNGHEDLINRMSNRDPIMPVLHRDYIDTFVNGQVPDDPLSGHGTFVAGIIGAKGDNNKGIAGVAWNIDVEFVSLRAFFTYVNDQGKEVSQGNVTDIISAINLAAANNIPIINYSAGEYAYRQNLYNAIALYDGLFVAGAGNDNTNNDGTSKFYPASYNLPNIIAVGASNTSDNKWSLSNYGANSVDIFAPGVGIWSTIPTTAVPSGYVTSSGTSFATAFVTGVAILIMSIKPNMSVFDIKNCILYSSDKISSLNGLCATGGRLNAEKAVLMARDGWQQPTWSSNSNAYGTISASSNISNEDPYGAFDGWVGSMSVGNSAGYSAAQWSASGTSGWIELNLNEYIKISKIIFYNRQSGGNNYTKNAFFTGMNGVPLGEPFEAVNEDYAVSVIEVNDVVTNVVKLDILSCHNTSLITAKYIGANEIKIIATPADAPDPGWLQPVWTSSTNSHGTITASGTYSNEHPWKAYNGTMLGGSGGSGDQWSVNATTGWLQLKLNYYIEVHNIVFYNGCSSTSNGTKNAKFTGRAGVPLGNPFTAPNYNFGYVYIPVGGVVTNVIQLNISSSYGSYIGASKIIINATELVTQPNEENWTQPIFTNYTNDHGRITASGYYSNELPWKAYNGTMLGGSGGNGDNWSVNAKTGWLELRLDYPVYVQSIEIYGNSSGSNNRTKGANFTGMSGVALGSSFQLANQNQAYQNVSVGGVWTNIIRLNITSSYGSYVGASLIIINATV